MTKKSIREIVESYMENDATDQTRVTFDAWLTDESSSAEKDRALCDIWESWPMTSTSAPENPYAIIEEAETWVVLKQQKNYRKRTLWLWAMSSVAACLAVLAVIGWNRTSQDSNVMCLASSSGSKADFVLPDGTAVCLNKNSRLYYYDDMNGETRRVSLEGEGYFDVAKDSERPFILQAKDMVIKVLGTRFTVSAYDDHIVDAYLEEGSIVALAPGHNPIILEPDHAVRYNVSNNEFTMYKEAASDHTAWADAKLEFVNKTLKDIIECLEHWY